MEKSDSGVERKSIIQFSKFTASLIIITGIIFIPQIFQRVFSFGDLLLQDKQGLIWSSVIFCLLGVLFFFSSKKTSIGLTLVAFSIVLLIWLELSFRLIVNIGAGEQFIRDMNFKSNVTYPEAQAYQGSPFMHFLGKPNNKLEGSMALKADHPYNNFGFMGDDFFYYKPRNVIRIACLGESTTADGYPRFLQDYLTSHNPFPGYRFEVYNFGQAYWTTAHSLSNFMLNVVDFSPDILVIHHGWNEAKIRNYDNNFFKGDYSHRFKSFEPPFVADRLIIRVSGIYRYFKFTFDKSPHWMSLAGTIENEQYPSHNEFTNEKELLPYTRNISNISRIALANKMKVVFATLPHSTDSNIAMRDGIKNIEQCNRITRTLSKDFGNDVILCDLDSVISGVRNDIFVDLGHVTDDGRRLKAEILGKVIFSDCDSLFMSNLKTNDKGFSDQDGLQYYLARMKNDRSWQENDLIPKAKRMNIPVDSVMKMDAQFLVEQDMVK